MNSVEIVSNGEDSSTIVSARPEVARLAMTAQVHSSDVFIAGRHPKRRRLGVEDRAPSDHSLSRGQMQSADCRCMEFRSTRLVAELSVSRPARLKPTCPGLSAGFPTL